MENMEKICIGMKVNNWVFRKSVLRVEEFLWKGEVMLWRFFSLILLIKKCSSWGLILGFCLGNYEVGL